MGAPTPVTKVPMDLAETSQTSPASLASVLCALSLATDVGMGHSLEHGLKSAYIGLRLGDAVGLSPDERTAVFYGALVKDAGCTACTAVFATFFGGDDLGPRKDVLLVQPTSVTDAVGWFWRH